MARIHLGIATALAAAAALLACERGGQDDRRAERERGQRTAETRREARGEAREGERRARAAPPRAGGRPSAERPTGATAQDEATARRAAPAPAARPRAEGREAALSHAWQGTVEGRVVRANEQEIVLRQEGGEPDLRLRVAPDTSVQVDGARSSVSRLREGTEVRASFAQRGGEPVATRIEAL